MALQVQDKNNDQVILFGTFHGKPIHQAFGISDGSIINSEAVLTKARYEAGDPEADLHLTYLPKQLA
jgi:hypothetical protein